METIHIIKNKNTTFELEDHLGVFINSNNLTSKNLSIFYYSHEENNFINIDIKPSIHYSFNGGTIIFQTSQNTLDLPFWKISHGHCSINNVAIIPHTMVNINASQFSKFCIFSPINLHSGILSIHLSNPLGISNFIILESTGGAYQISKDSQQYEISNPFILVGRSPTAPIGTFHLSFSSLRPDDSPQFCAIQPIQNVTGQSSNIIPSYKCVDIEKPAFKLWIANLLLILIFICLLILCNKKQYIDLFEFLDIKRSQAPKPTQVPSIQEDLVIENIENSDSSN